MIVRHIAVQRSFHAVDDTREDAATGNGWTCCGYEGLYSSFVYTANGVEVRSQECQLCNQTDVFGLTKHEVETLADRPDSAYALLTDIELMMVNPYDWNQELWPEKASWRAWLRSLETRSYLSTAIDAYMDDKYTETTRFTAKLAVAETIRAYVEESIDADDECVAILEFTRTADPLEVEEVLEAAKSHSIIAEHSSPDFCECERCETSDLLIEDCECHTCLAETGQTTHIHANCMTASECAEHLAVVREPDPVDLPW